MQGYPNSKPLELPPVEFRRLLESGYETIASRGELKELILTTLQEFDALCTRLGEKCTLRILLEAEAPGATTESYEVRILRKAPNDYYTIQNINGNGIGEVYSILYEVFLVSDDIIDVETSRAQTLKIETRRTRSIQETIENLITTLDHKQPPQQQQVKEEKQEARRGDPKLQEALQTCINHTRNKEPSTSPINMLLEAVVEGIGYHKTSEGTIHCLIDTKRLTQWHSNECKYLLLTIRGQEIQGTECYTDTTQILTTKTL